MASGFREGLPPGGASGPRRVGTSVAAPRRVNAPSQDVREGLSAGNLGFTAQTSRGSACAEIRGRPHGELDPPCSLAQGAGRMCWGEGTWAPWEPLTTSLCPPDLRFPCPPSYRKPPEVAALFGRLWAVSLAREHV